MAKREVMTDQERATGYLKNKAIRGSLWNDLSHEERNVYLATMQLRMADVRAGIRIGRALATAGGLPGKRRGKSKAKRTTVRRGRAAR